MRMFYVDYHIFIKANIRYVQLFYSWTCFFIVCMEIGLVSAFSEFLSLKRIQYLRYVRFMCYRPIVTTDRGCFTHNYTSFYFFSTRVTKLTPGVNKYTVLGKKTLFYCTWFPEKKSSVSIEISVDIEEGILLVWNVLLFLKYSIFVMSWWQRKMIFFPPEWLLRLYLWWFLELNNKK